MIRNGATLPFFITLLMGKSVKCFIVPRVRNIVLKSAYSSRSHATATTLSAGGDDLNEMHGFEKINLLGNIDVKVTSRSSFLSQSFTSMSAAILLQSSLLDTVGAEDIPPASDEIISTGGTVFAENISPASNEVTSTVGTVSTDDIPPASDQVTSTASQPPVVLKKKRSLDGCPTKTDRNNVNCVSTSNVKQISLYSPPWTFECGADEAFTRIKGVIDSDETLNVIEVDNTERYIKVSAPRSFPDQDVMEFLVKDDDKVVIFKAGEKEVGGSLSDFGANRKRIEAIRQKCDIFDVMGGGSTADSDSGMQNRNGPLGQLKAFYGFQSGQGFQDVFDK